MTIDKKARIDPASGIILLRNKDTTMFGSIKKSLNYEGVSAVFLGFVSVSLLEKNIDQVTLKSVFPGLQRIYHVVCAACILCVKSFDVKISSSWVFFYFSLGVDCYANNKSISS